MNSPVSDSSKETSDSETATDESAAAAAAEKTDSLEEEFYLVDGACTGASNGVLADGTPYKSKQVCCMAIVSMTHAREEMQQSLYCLSFRSQSLSHSQTIFGYCCSPPWTQEISA